MKKELFLILGFFLSFYFCLGLFLPNAKGLLFLSSYLANVLKYLIGNLAFFLPFSFIFLYIYFYKNEKQALLYLANSFLGFLFFALFLAKFLDFGLLGFLGDLAYLLALLILLFLIYINFSFLYALKNSLKSQDKVAISTKTFEQENSKIIKEEKILKNEVLSDLGDVRFVSFASDEEFPQMNLNPKKQTFKPVLNLEPFEFSKDLKNKNAYKDTKESYEKENDDVIAINDDISDETSEIETIKNDEAFVKSFDDRAFSDEIRFIDEPDSQSFVPKQVKKVQILSEIEENKAFLSQLELGVVELPRDFELPSIELLEKPEQKELTLDEGELDEKINDLLEKLKYFKIDGDVVKTYSGPVITTFEFKPVADVKVSKISSLADDLAMALKAISIRIQAPIPGKDVVGIEIPNKTSQMINIRTIFEDELFLKSKSKLTIALGKDIVGNTFITDLKKLPHLLIAGTTGSGKSVGVNAMILSLLYKNTPRTLRLLMIDPKMLEFSMYNDIPHLLTPVITKAEKATIALKNMVAEMERRNELMAKAQVKNIESFNEKATKCGLEPFAYIVIIIDELADLMMTSGKEVELYIARLAQMARAAGIHLIVATQRPSVDVVTGLIKANLPSRLSYKVSTQMDSKVILGMKGAETLLGRGDSLFTPPGSSQIVRLHAPFTSEEEIIRVVEYLKSQEKVVYDESILQDSNLASEFVRVGNEETDELFDEAVKVMRESGKTSISYIQRQLSIGYNRAANIIEQCEKQGILSEPNAKGVRNLL